MHTAIQRLVNDLARARAQNEAVADELARDNLRVVQKLALAVVALNLLHALLFRWPGPADAAEVMQWKQALLHTHLGMAATVSLLGLLAWAIHRWPQAPPLLARGCGWVFFVAGLGYTALIVAIDQRVTPSITPFLIGCVLSGVVLLQRPLASALLYSLALAVFAGLLGTTQRDAAVLMSNRVNGLTAAAIGCLLATMNWRKTTSNLLLARQLELRQQQLLSQQGVLERLATRDGLTGLLNRAEMERVSRQELARAQRHGLPVSLLVVDLDHFKRVNDRWGHPAGDAVLVAAAAVLGRSVRGSDVVARLGGEEFMVLLPHTDAPAALALAEKLRERLEAMVVPGTDPAVAVTASVGVASAGPEGELAFDALYRRADRALYRAKDAGRNRVGTDPC
jgi:diguanylate cyclase (GGDEF)-like protein